MSLETFAQAIRQLQGHISTQEGRANVLANIAELEERGRLDIAHAQALRALIDCLSGADLSGEDVFALERLALAIEKTLNE
jgi:hypothetical protein